MKAENFIILPWQNSMIAREAMMSISQLSTVQGKSPLFTLVKNSLIWAKQIKRCTWSQSSIFEAASFFKDWFDNVIWRWITISTWTYQKDHELFYTSSTSFMAPEILCLSLWKSDRYTSSIFPTSQFYILWAASCEIFTKIGVFQIWVNQSWYLARPVRPAVV